MAENWGKFGKIKNNIHPSIFKRLCIHFIFQVSNVFEILGPEKNCLQVQVASFPNKHASFRVKLNSKR